jgi:hypothetical protein
VRDVRVQDATSPHVQAGLGNTVGARDAPGGLAHSGVAAGVTRAPTRTFTDEHDVMAASGVIPVNRVRRPRLVPRRPDEEQRSFAHSSTTRSSPRCIGCQGCTPANQALADDGGGATS